MPKMLQTELSAPSAQAVIADLRQLVSEGYTVTFTKPTQTEWGRVGVDKLPDDAVHVQVLRADGSKVSGGYGWQDGMMTAYGTVPEDYTPQDQDARED